MKCFFCIKVIAAMGEGNSCCNAKLVLLFLMLNIFSVYFFWSWIEIWPWCFLERHPTSQTTLSYNCLQDKSFHIELSKCEISRENVKELKRNGLILEMFEIAASYCMDRNERVEMQNGKKVRKLSWRGTYSGKAVHFKSVA